MNECLSQIRIVITGECNADYIASYIVPPVVCRYYLE